MDNNCKNFQVKEYRLRILFKFKLKCNYNWFIIIKVKDKSIESAEPIIIKFPINFFYLIKLRGIVKNYELNPSSEKL